MGWSREEIERIRDEARRLEAARDRLIELAREAIKRSKNAIYAAIREDLKAAAGELSACWRAIEALDALQAGEPALFGEEIAAVARGEAVEAEAVVRVAGGGALPRPDELPVAVDLVAYLQGLLDATGELLRAAGERLLAGDRAFAERAKAAIEAVYFLALEAAPKRYDLRRKLDYVAGNLQKLTEARLWARPC